MQVKPHGVVTPEIMAIAALAKKWLFVCDIQPRGQCGKGSQNQGQRKKCAY